MLVIDDEPYIGRMIAMQFERGPFRVSVATDGPSGLAFLRAHPDLAVALVDVHLPGGLTGLDVMAEARAEPALAALPFVVLTASGQTAQMDRARALGAAAFVTKPFSPSRLYRQVCALVGEHAPEEED